jgi:hypothetical protein
MVTSAGKENVVESEEGGTKRLVERKKGEEEKGRTGVDTLDITLRSGVGVHDTRVPEEKIAGLSTDLQIEEGLAGVREEKRENEKKETHLLPLASPVKEPLLLLGLKATPIDGTPRPGLGAAGLSEVLGDEAVRALKNEKSAIVRTVVVEVDDALKAVEALTEGVLICEKKKS